MKPLSRGLLIALEGIDGSGKSTLAHALSDYFHKQNIPILLTKEPGGSPLGKIIRPLLQEQKVNTCSQAEFLLFAADRAQHFQEIIIPALQQNMMVISDRLADSSLVYQGFGRGLSLAMITTINNWIMQNHKPDITFYLELNPTTAFARLKKRNDKPTIFEQDEALSPAVFAGFEYIYKNCPNKNRPDVIILDAEQDIETLQQQAIQKLTNFIKAQQL